MDGDLRVRYRRIFFMENLQQIDDDWRVRHRRIFFMENL